MIEYEIHNLQASVVLCAIARQAQLPDVPTVADEGALPLKRHAPVKEPIVVQKGTVQLDEPTVREVVQPVLARPKREPRVDLLSAPQVSPPPEPVIPIMGRRRRRSP